MSTIMVIPDCQVRPGVSLRHLTAIGKYAAEKQPDVIVNLGDFADMPSLSRYSIGTAEAEGARYRADIECAQDAMAMLMAPIKARSGYRPRMILTLGNHEDRIDREANANPRWKGFLTTRDLGYEKHGWKVVPFLRVANVNGVEFSHYFVTGTMARPASSAAALLRQRQRSAIMGHVQKIDFAIHPQTQQTALMAGVCYTHDEKFLTPQGNNCKRGIWMLHEVRGGRFDLMFVSLGFLMRKYK